MTDWVKWLDTGMILGLSAMLGVAGYQLMDSVRIMRRQNRAIEQYGVMSKEMLEFIYFQRGMIVAFQAGVIAPWMLEPVDLRDLPIEMRVAIWRSLLDVGIEAYSPPEEAQNEQAHAGA